MQFEFRRMDKSYAEAIANWHYEGAHAFYDMDRDAEDLEELLDAGNWESRYCAVVDKHGELIGFFCFDKQDDALVVGLGLRPDCTGRGLGLAFIEAGLEYARRQFAPAAFRLSVATFNRRAIRVYERAGFKPDGVFITEANGRQCEFLRMVRRA
jgi:ribosomal-protein-alanine N-acetyltransferase